MNKYKSYCTISSTSFVNTLVNTNKSGRYRLSIRGLRILSVIMIHLLFVVSFYFDIQILEGDISGSRLFGFHLADPFIALQAIFASKSLPANLIIGSMSILLFYFIVGGRAFCAWVCPYGILSEIAEKIHNTLVHKRLIKSHRSLPKYTRYIVWFIFISLALSMGMLVFELFNVVGILSRFIIYGYSLAILWVFVVFLLEIFISRRFWCSHICPLGTSYMIFSGFSLTKIVWDKKRCDDCGVCIDVCFVNDVLKITKKYGKSNNGERFSLKGSDCTLCGRCVDVCHEDALIIENRVKNLI